MNHKHFLHSLRIKWRTREGTNENEKTSSTKMYVYVLKGMSKNQPACKGWEQTLQDVLTHLQIYPGHTPLIGTIWWPENLWISDWQTCLSLFDASGVCNVQGNAHRVWWPVLKVEVQNESAGFTWPNMFCILCALGRNIFNCKLCDKRGTEGNISTLKQ